jgi:hypothetical protein
MDNWRPDKKVGGNQIRFWGAISFPSVSIKDRSLLVPLIMLNTCLIFSWPNKVPSDREVSGIIRAGIYTGACISAEGGMTGARRVSPRACKSWFLAVGWSLGTTAPVCPVTFTCIVSLVICSSLDWWVWFVWGINHQLVRNRFESPSLLHSEHLTRLTAL